MIWNAFGLRPLSRSWRQALRRASGGPIERTVASRPLAIRAGAFPDDACRAGRETRRRPMWNQGSEYQARSHAGGIRSSGRRCRGVHEIEHGRRTRPVVPQASWRWHRQGACRQFGQCQCLYRQGRVRCRRGHGGECSSTRRRASRGDLHRLYRRHRRDASRIGHRRGTPPHPGDAARRRLARCGGSDHDHRYLSQGSLGENHDRRDAGDDHRHRQRFRDDRAEHGHHAGLRVHGCGTSGQCPAAPSGVGSRPFVQFDHRRQRHLDQRHAAAFRHRPRAAPRHQRQIGSFPEALPQGARWQSVSISPTRS